MMPSIHSWKIICGENNYCFSGCPINIFAPFTKKQLQYKWFKWNVSYIREFLQWHWQTELGGWVYQKWSNVTQKPKYTLYQPFGQFIHPCRQNSQDLNWCNKNNNNNNNNGFRWIETSKIVFLKNVKILQKKKKTLKRICQTHILSNDGSRFNEFSIFLRF